MPDREDQPTRPLDLSELVALALDRMEAEGAAGLDAICAAHPEHAEKLRKRIAKLADLGMLGDDLDTSAAYTDLENTMPARLGEFVPKRLLGGGGMGIVYLAEQESLGREVALKLVRPEQLVFPGTRERFRREVETIARLQHPGIVPIFGVYEENGVPFFAMERVRGCSLSEALDRLAARDAKTLTGRDLAEAVARECGDELAPDAPIAYVFHGTYEQACLRITRQVADALEFAHDEGVVHRDVKPSNVMITPGGRAMLLDFGLASTADSGRLTRTGSKLGSLYYMAPEQCRGATDEIGPRTDVYALGVTLYEMLTLETAFRADSEPQVAQRILDGRPTSPRRMNAAVTWEAETVCLNAMEVEAKRRYARASDFASDLGNVLDRRPIDARRAGTLLRMRRFMQRRPGEAVAIALGLLLITGGPLGYAMMKRDAFDRLEREQARVERNFSKAVEAVDTMLTRVGDDTLRFVPEMEQVRRGLLEDALAFYRSFVEDAEIDGGDFTLRAETARVEARVGEIRTSLGDHVGAERSLRTAVDELHALAAERPTDHAILLGLAEATELLGETLYDTARSQEAADLMVPVIERLETTLTDRTSAIDVRVILSSLHHARGLWSDGDPEVAEASYAKALEYAEGLLAEHPDHRDYRGKVATTGSMLSMLHYRTGRSKDAEAGSRRAVDLLTALVEENATDHRNEWTLAGTLYNLSTFIIERDVDEAQDLCLEALEIWERAARAFPSTPRFPLEIANVRDRLSRIAHAQGRTADGYAQSRATADDLRAYIRRHPDVADARMQLGITLNSLTVQLRSGGRPDEGLEAADEATAVIEEFVARHGESVDALYHLGGVHHNAARCLDDLGKKEAAIARFRRAIARGGRALELVPEHARARVYLRNHYWMLAEALLAVRAHAETVAAAEHLPEIFPESASEWRRAAAFVSRAAWPAAADPELSEEERLALALRYDARAIELVHAAIEHGYDNRSDLLDCELFARIRRLPAFEELLERLAAP